LSIRHVYVERATLVGSAIDYFLVVPSIKELAIEDCNNKFLLSIAQGCPALRSLTIRWKEYQYPNVDEQHLMDAAFEALASNCKDLEEIAYDRRVFADCDGYLLPTDFYERSAAALIQLLRRCAKLKKVSLNGNTLWDMKLEELVPFGHLFHVLEFVRDYREPNPATGQPCRTYSPVAPTWEGSRTMAAGRQPTK
jgi:hypothetical protein